jgi:uncharacterized protein YaiI (UPF0178 family)
MKTISKTLIATSLGLLVALPALAQQNEGRYIRHDDISERLERQHHRIKKGVKAGQLTGKEAKTLRQHQRDIRYLERLFREDGKLTKKERRILNRELRDSSRQIDRLKHNDLERYVNLHHRYNHRVPG